MVPDAAVLYYKGDFTMINEMIIRTILFKIRLKLCLIRKDPTIEDSFIELTEYLRNTQVSSDDSWNGLWDYCRSKSVDRYFKLYWRGKEEDIFCSRGNRKRYVLRHEILTDSVLSFLWCIKKEMIRASFWETVAHVLKMIAINL